MASHLVSLKRTKKDINSDEIAVGSKEAFPYGLAISLEDDTLNKLGMKKLPAVGEMMIVAAVGRVESVSERDGSSGKSRSVRIQFEKMDIGPLKSPKAATAEDAVTDAIEREV